MKKLIKEGKKIKARTNQDMILLTLISYQTQNPPG